jgi:hypothetical protein
MLNNIVQLGQQQYNSMLKGGGGAATQGETAEEKFNIVPIDCLISNKTMLMTAKPSKAYVEI